MPRHPSLASSARALPPSVFEKLKRKLAAAPGAIMPLHIGDTHLPPPAASRLGALGFSSGPDPDLYRYSPPAGKPLLLEAVVAKLRRRNRLEHVVAENIQITSGATHALSCAVRCLLEPGDELLLLAPYWPLIHGIALSAGVRPIDVPFSHVLLRDPTADPAALIEPHITPRTAAIYLSSPNNPDGMVLSAAQLAAIAAVAERHGLWLLSDEVYEDLIYDGREHHSPAALHGMSERTISVYSFSKSYGQAGLRVGYVVGSIGAIAAIRKMANHTVYCVPRAMQLAALVALEQGDPFLVDVRRLYQEARDLAQARLASCCLTPQGATYLFLDLTDLRRAGEEDALGVLERLVEEAGVLLAPGGAFGHAYRSWARLCFTSVGREALAEGLERIAAVLARG